VVVANFCNNKKLLGKFASVSVSNVSRELKRVERVFVDQFHHKRETKL
jgi:hypothetical protein